MGATGAAEVSRRYFDGRAETWEAERQAYYSDAVREHIVHAAAFGPGDAVLDYGAGSGYLTGALLAAGIARVIATDVSASMLLALGERYGRRVEQRLADGGRMPLMDAEVDGVVANMVLHHLDAPELFFAEAARVLKPGGRVVVTDLVAYDAADLTRDQHDRWPGFEPRTVERWMKAAGLTQIHAGVISERCCGSVKGAGGGVDIFLARATRP